MQGARIVSRLTKFPRREAFVPLSRCSTDSISEFSGRSKVHPAVDFAHAQWSFLTKGAIEIKVILFQDNRRILAIFTTCRPIIVIGGLPDDVHRSQTNDIRADRLASRDTANKPLPPYPQSNLLARQAIGRTANSIADRAIEIPFLRADSR
jgi:hypothetical protein